MGKLSILFSLPLIFIANIAFALNCDVGESRISLADYGIVTDKGKEAYDESVKSFLDQVGDSGPFALLLIKGIVDQDPFSQKGGAFSIDLSDSNPRIGGTLKFKTPNEDGSDTSLELPLEEATCSILPAAGRTGVKLSLQCVLEDMDDPGESLYVKVFYDYSNDKGTLKLNRGFDISSLISHNEITCKP